MLLPCARRSRIAHRAHHLDVVRCSALGSVTPVHTNAVEAASYVAAAGKASEVQVVVAPCRKSSVAWALEGQLVTRLRVTCNPVVVVSVSSDTRKTCPSPGLNATSQRPVFTVTVSLGHDALRVGAQGVGHRRNSQDIRTFGQRYGRKRDASRAAARCLLARPGRKLPSPH